MVLRLFLALSLLATPLHAAIDSIVFPVPAFRPNEATPVAASQAVLTFDVDATPSRYRVDVFRSGVADQIVESSEVTKVKPAGTLERLEVRVPLREGGNSFFLTLTDLEDQGVQRTSGSSPSIQRDLLSDVVSVTLDSIEPPVRVTNRTQVTLEFTINGTADTYQVDVVRNAALATSFTTAGAGTRTVPVDLAADTSNDLFLRVSSNDPFASGVRVESSIIRVVQDSQAPRLRNVSAFPGPITDNAVVNILGEIVDPTGASEPFARVVAEDGQGGSFQTESDAIGNFQIFGVGLPLLPPGPTVTTFTIRATDAAGNVSLPFNLRLTRNAAEPRFEFITLLPGSGRFVQPGTPIHARGAVGESSFPFDVNFFLRATVGGFELEERLTDLRPGDAFEKDFHLVPLPSDPASDVIYSVEAQVTSTAGRSVRQLVGEAVLDNSDPAPPTFPSRFNRRLATNAPRFLLDGAAERFSTVEVSTFPGIILRPAALVPVDSTLAIEGGEFRTLVDVSNVDDGDYSIDATVVATSGRSGGVASRASVSVRRDTQEPRVVSIDVNGTRIGGGTRLFFRARQFVTFRITLDEPMAVAPSVFITERGAEALPAPLSATVLPGLVFEYTYLTDPLEVTTQDGGAELVVAGGRDDAGNVLPEFRVPDIFFLDTQAPALDPSRTRPADGSVVSSAPARILFAFRESPLSVEPPSGIDVEASEVRVFGPLQTDPTRERRGRATPFSPEVLAFSFEEGEFVEPGTYQFRIVARDRAGNENTQNYLLFLDRDDLDPSLLIATDPAGGAILSRSSFPVDGTTGRDRISATFSEAVSGELDLAATTLALGLSCPDQRPVTGSRADLSPRTAVLRLTAPLARDGSDDGLYTIFVQPRDIAGNETPVITRQFTYDTTPPSVLGGAFLGLGRFGTTFDDTFFPAQGQLVGGPLRVVRAEVVDGVSRNGYPGSGVGTQATTGTTVVLTLIRRHPTTLPGLPVGSSTTNTPLLSSTLRFVDIQPPVTSPCFTGTRRAVALLELNRDPVTGDPIGLTTGGAFDGDYSITVFPVDRAGNRGPADLSTFVYDSIPPRHLELAGITNDEVLTRRTLSLSGLVQDNDKGPEDTAQGIAQVTVTLERADSSFQTTGAPLLVTTPATLPPNIGLLEAEAQVRWRIERELPPYNGNARLTVAARDVAGNVARLVRRLVVQTAPLGRPKLLEPAAGTAVSGPVVTFLWEEVPGASGYRLRVQDPQGNEIVRRTDRTTPTSRINLVDFTEGEYSWTVEALDTAGQPGDPAFRALFDLDLTPPKLLEVFAFDGTVPDAEAGEVLNGQIRIGLRFSESMDTSVIPTVTLRAADRTIPPTAVRQISYGNESWRGLVDVPPAPESPDFNGVAQVTIEGAADRAGNRMPRTTAGFEIDLGPFWVVRAFANPIEGREVLFHLKALTSSGGTLEEIQGLPRFRVAQTGGEPVLVPVRRLGPSIFAGTYTVDLNLQGTTRLTITGTDLSGNTSTRVVAFSVSRIIAARRNLLTGIRQGFKLALPAGAVTSDTSLMVFPPGVASPLDPTAEDRQALSKSVEPDPPELVPVASISGFLPELTRLSRDGELTVDTTRLARARGIAPRALGVYRWDPARSVLAYQPTSVVEGELRARVEALSALYVMADLRPPRLEVLQRTREGHWLPSEEGGDEPLRVAPGLATSVRIREGGSGLDRGTLTASGGGVPWRVFWTEPDEPDPLSAIVQVAPMRPLPGGEHTLSLKVSDMAGNEARFQAAAAAPLRPDILSSAVWPNPARRVSTIRYRLAGPGQQAVIRIFDASGDRVTRLVGPALAGVNEVPWPLDDEDGRLVSNGVYFVKLRVDDLAGGPPARTRLKLAVLR